MDDSIKEQSKRSVESYIARDIEKSADWEKRDKRQVSSADYPMPVPQTDSEAAKGTPKASHCLGMNYYVNFFGGIGSW